MHTFVPLLLFVLFACKLAATTFTWTGAMTNVYGTAGNWTPTGGPPGSGDIAFFQNIGGSITLSPGGSAAGTMEFTYSMMTIPTFTVGTGNTFTIGNGAGTGVVFSGCTVNTEANFIASGAGAILDIASGSIANGSMGISFFEATMGGTINIAAPVTSQTNGAFAGIELNTGTLTTLSNLTISDIQSLSSSDQTMLGGSLTLLANSGLGSNVAGTIVDNGTAGSLIINPSTALTTTLSNASNTYTGGTTLSSGTLNFITGALGTGPVTLAAGTTLQAGGTANLSSGQTVTLTGNATVDTNSHAMTFAGAIGDGSHGFSLTKISSGTLTLTASNTYSGGTTISAGTLALSGSGALTAAGAVAVSGTFDISQISGSSTQVGDLTGSGTVDLGSKSLTVGTSASMVTYSGLIADGGLGGGTGGSLIKTGTGVVILSGATNSYTGGTTVNTGTLNFITGALGTGPLTLGALTTLQAGGTASFSHLIQLTGSATLDTNGNAMTLSNVIGDSGGGFSITKVGSGILTFSAANTYSGGTIINAGTLALSTSGALDSIAPVVANSTFDISQITASSTTIGNLSGSGVIALGGKELKTGTSTTTTTYSGSIQDGGIGGGSGGILLKQGTGALLLTGASSSYTGGTLLNAGTLGFVTGALGTGTVTLAAGTTLQAAGAASLSQTVTLGGSAAVDTNGNAMTISGNIGDGGMGFALTKISSGTLTLSGTNTYTGLTTVSGGTLLLRGSIAGSATVNAGAILQGNGTVHGTVTLGAGGTIYPFGSSPGTMPILGDFDVSSPTSVITIEIDPFGNASLLQITGNANLSGNGSLQVTADSGVYTNGTLYTILTTGGSVNGQFASTNLSSLLPRLDLQIIYNAKSVQLMLLQAINGFTSSQLGSLSGNSLALANYLNTLSTQSLGSSFNSLLSLTGSPLQTALETMSPSRNSAINYVSQITLFQLSDLLDARFTAQRIPRKHPSDLFTMADEDLVAAFKDRWITPKPKKVIPADHNSLWLIGFGDFARQAAADENPRFGVKTAGFLIGYDYGSEDVGIFRADTALIGAAGGFVHSSLTHNNNFGKSEFDAGYLTVYSTLYASQFYFDFAWWNGWEHIETTRNVFFSGFSGRAESRHNCNLGDIHFATGYDLSFETDALTGIFEPFAAFDWAFNNERGYHEHGAAPYNMDQKSRFSCMIQAEAGVTAYFNWDFDEGILTMRDKLSYINRQPFGVGNATVHIVGMPGAFSVTAFTKNQSIFSPSVELGWRKNNGSYGSLLYDGEFGSGWISNEVVARVGRFF